MGFISNVLSGLKNYYRVVRPGHIGSWGLPDFGITEAYAAAVGAPRNPQTGGSEVRQPQSWQTQPSINAPQIIQARRNYGTSRITQSAPQTPQVLGAKTGGTSSVRNNQPNPQPSTQPPQSQPPQPPGPTPEEIAAQQAAEEARRREEAIRSQIEGGFGEIFSMLDKMAGLVPQEEQQMEQYLQQSFGKALEGLKQEKEAQLQKLGTYKQDIQREARQRSQEIASNIRNLLFSSQNMIGALGAGASSAADVMLPYALSKQAAKAGAQVASQAVAQLGELKRKELDIGNTFMRAQSELEQEKISKIAALRKEYNDLKRRIEEAKLSAKGQRLQALINLDTMLAQQARARAEQLDAEYRQKKSAIEEWARNRLAKLDDIKLALQQTAQFNPRQLVYDELRGLGSLYAGMGESGEDILNPLVLLKKRRQRKLQNL